MGFSIDKAVTVVAFKINYPRLYQNGTSEAVKLGFECRRETVKEMTGPMPDPPERLARMLVNPPAGFDDFPAEGSLSDRAKDYFNRCEETKIIAFDACRAYDIMTAAVME